MVTASGSGPARRPQARQLRVDRPTWSRDVLL